MSYLLSLLYFLLYPSFIVLPLSLAIFDHFCLVYPVHALFYNSPFYYPLPSSLPVCFIFRLSLIFVTICLQSYFSNIKLLIFLLRHCV